MTLTTSNSNGMREKRDKREKADRRGSVAACRPFSAWLTIRPEPAGHFDR